MARLEIKLDKLTQKIENLKSEATNQTDKEAEAFFHQTDFV
jgi:hypothetical protein